VEVCKNKSAGNGLRALRVALRKIDFNENGLINPVEFKFSLKLFGIHILEDETALLLKYFDPERSGRLSVNELLHMIREGSLNEKRLQIVEAAYNKLDQRRNQTVTIEDLEAAYDSSVNPEFVFGHKTKEQLLAEFMSVWDTHHRTGVINLAEFIDFYMDVSPTVKSDAVFENMVRHTWNL